MSKEFSEQKKIFPDINPEHERAFDFYIEPETEVDKKRGVLRIRDGSEVFTFSLGADDDVRCHTDLKRALTPEKARKIMGLALQILIDRKDCRDHTNEGELEF